MVQDPYRYFRPEARNLLDQFAQGILELENSVTAGAVQRLLRLAHTLKGAARVVRQTAIAERAHAIEDALAPYRESADGLARESIDVILALLDEIAGQIVTLVPADIGEGGHGKSAAADGAASAAPKETANAALEAPRVIRADMADMDAVLDGIAEAHARLGALWRNAEAIEQVEHLADLLRAQLAAPGGSERGRAASGARNQALATADDLRRNVDRLAGDFQTAVSRVDRELRQLRDAAEAMRLVSVDSVFVALKRTARDAARALSKEVTFEGRGGDIRLDADVLGMVQSALIQIIRNAVAHGIEAASERAAAGKPAAGRVTVSVSRRGSTIVFLCSDDGRGIDLAAVQKIAIERGLLKPDAIDVSAQDLVAVLLRGGVSTSTAVTDVSGRGVGLDVVREALERLGGEVTVRIEPGRGTTFELVIPGSVSSVAALLVEAERGGGAVAIPLDGVRRILRLVAADINFATTGASVVYDDKAIAFVPLAAALADSPWATGRAWTAVVVAGASGTVAVGVERLIGTAQTVVRPLPGNLDANPIIVGAWVDGEGIPRLMLDPDGLAMAASGRRAAQSEAAPAKRPVLVVDDSLTTRMLEKSILESAGYDVDVACSGEEGLDLVRRKAFALILCDVEMPGIDGFTFVERIRADAASRDIPAILVTSRAAPEDRQRGRDVGAQGYIVKSEFNQAELLTMIRPIAS